MRIYSVVSDFLAVNSHVVVPEGADRAVLVDAGVGCAAGISRLLEEHGLTVGAVLLTHGHADHVLGLPEFVASGFGVTPYLGAPDAYRMDDPLGTTSPGIAAMVPHLADWTRPEVEEVDGTTEIRLGIEGLQVTALPAPGHTEGSTLYRIADASDEVLFTGDVLFAGSIGRVDLPGGDAEVMRTTLAGLAALPDLPVYPGHGPSTSVAAERASNPFLREKGF